MNELEIAVWSLALDTRGWHDSDLDRDTLLLLTGFHAKVSGL